MLSLQGEPGALMIESSLSFGPRNEPGRTSAMFAVAGGALLNVSPSMKPAMLLDALAKSRVTGKACLGFNAALAAAVAAGALSIQPLVGRGEFTRGENLRLGRGRQTDRTNR
jgi:hypothetical protein